MADLEASCNLLKEQRDILETATSEEEASTEHSGLVQQAIHDFIPDWVLVSNTCPQLEPEFNAAGESVPGEGQDVH